jgi:tripartite-type tricarboxylate transporter receptor subunit TctC
MKSLLAIAILGAAIAAAPAAAADTYPSRVIKIVNPYVTGGTNAFFAELLAKSLTEQLGVTVIVEPQPGAGGNIGSATVARAEPDGYTLLAGTSGSNAVNPALYKNMPYDARRDLRLVATLSSVDNVLVVPSDSSYKSVSNIIEDAKSDPGKVMYGSSGIGSVLHLCGAMMASIAGTTMTHVPYKGTAPAMVDVMSGRVSFMFANAPSVIGQIKAGQLRALAVTGSQRSSVLPNVPTMQEAGVPGFDLTSWFGVFAPARTPEPIVAKLNHSIRKFLEEPTTKERFASQSATPLIMDERAAQAFFLRELDSWARVVKVSGAQVD